MTRLAWLKKVQDALEEINLSNHEYEFKVHPFYRAGMSRTSHDAIESVFGRNFRGKFKNFRKLEWLTAPKFSGKLPEDSIIFFRDDKEGLIAASFEKKLAFKIFFSKPYIAPLEAEIKTLKTIQKTEFAPYSPKVLSEGTSQNGGRWVITSFCPNRDNPQNSSFPEEFLLNVLHSKILPKLAKFYQGFHPEKIELHDWLNEARERVGKHPESEKLQKLINYLSLAPNFTLVVSNIHHDLHSGNILMDQDLVTIIDWESEVRGLVLIDVFDFWRRFIMKKNLPVFNDYPEIIRNSFLKYRNWMKEIWQEEVPDDLNLMASLYALERTLLLYEKRKVNRLKDLKGMEYKILKAIE